MFSPKELTPWRDSNPDHQFLSRIRWPLRQGSLSPSCRQLNGSTSRDLLLPRLLSYHSFYSQKSKKTWFLWFCYSTAASIVDKKFLSSNIYQTEPLLKCCRNRWQMFLQFNSPFFWGGELKTNDRMLWHTLSIQQLRILDPLSRFDLDQGSVLKCWNFLDKKKQYCHVFLYSKNRS
jgi:hypothetical protein